MRVIENVKLLVISYRCSSASPHHSSFRR